MKNEAEIQKLLDELESVPNPLDCQGDNFQYGLYLGKLQALGWVVGDTPSDLIASRFDFESFNREWGIEVDELSGDRRP